MKQIDKLIINSPYEKPKKYWSYDSSTKEFSLTDGRREAGYLLASKGYKGDDDPGVFYAMKTANNIRRHLDEWRRDDWPGATGISKQLLRHWSNRGSMKFFFCQLEAIETLIWLCEVGNSDAKKILEGIKGDGGGFIRLCNKMATGSGKTIVMGMINCWQILNKVRTPDDERFSKNILVIAPGLTVKSRLAVLDPSEKNNYYEKFNLVPPSMKDSFTQGKVIIHNWHTLAWENKDKLRQKKSVDKRGPKSDNAYVKELLKPLEKETDWILLNDEAHHAWRENPSDPHKGTSAIGMDADSDYIKENKKTATIWIEGLDRIHRARCIKYCFDMSATPFAPTGGKNYESALFNWIVSDFGLNDAIESGLVKTPRVPTSDNTKKADAQNKTRLFHIYNDPEVKKYIVKNDKELERADLPALVMQAYNLMGSCWQNNYKEWKKAGSEVPPVLITVANNTTTSTRIENAFLSGDIKVKELCKKKRILRIDSKILKNAEEAKAGFNLIENAGRGGDRTQKEREQELRQMVNTVGVQNAPGAQFCNIISVAMLSEGWDANTVTNIIGIRAFTSQLLCEQVIGRGLRRASYEVGDDGLFTAEYVDVYGVPFSFLPHEDKGTAAPIKPKKEIAVDPNKVEHKICWPNIIGINYKYSNKVNINLDKIKPVQLDPEGYITEASITPTVASKTMERQVADRQNLYSVRQENRFNTYIFETAKKVCDDFANITDPLAHKNAMASDIDLMKQIITIVKNFIAAGKIQVMHRIPDNDWKVCKDFEDKIDQDTLLSDLSSSRKVVLRISSNLIKHNVKNRIIIYDPYQKIRCTSDMASWYTGKPWKDGTKSHINPIVFDSKWEDCYAYKFEGDKRVKNYVKNDEHVGFKIYYRHLNTVHIYYPDYIVLLENDKKEIEHVIVEVKGREWEGDAKKEIAVKEWVEAVNESGEWGIWQYQKYN